MLEVDSHSIGQLYFRMLGNKQVLLKPLQSSLLTGVINTPPIIAD